MGHGTAQLTISWFSNRFSIFLLLSFIVVVTVLITSFHKANNDVISSDSLTIGSLKEKTTNVTTADGSFSMLAAGRLWDKLDRCTAFREKHKDLIELYGNGGADTWEPSPNFKDWNKPVCNELKQKHVSIYMADTAWFRPNWLEGLHTCTRCGLTCQFSWSETLADHPDAEVYVGHNRPPGHREKGDPLRVYLSFEPNKWNIFTRNADIGVGYGPEHDVQSTYARPRESRQHFLSSIKRQDVLLYRATSNCNPGWRNEIAQNISEGLPHHSFGACQNNVGGRGQELEFYPHCRFMPGTRGPALDWQEIGHCVMSHYKFVLSMENVQISNYVTEKLFMALEAGVVPIYFGAPDVEKFAPPESYINGDNFDTINDLLKYIKKLHENPVEYMNYFAWRRCGVMGHLTRARALSLDTMPCRLCEKVSQMGGRNFKGFVRVSRSKPTKKRKGKFRHL